MIHVRALGACEIQIGRKRITLTTEVPFALAFYLTHRAGETVSRDELAELFWGATDPSKSRHSLRQTLYKLRLKGLPLDEGAEEIVLGRELVESDVADVLAPAWGEGASEEAVLAAADFLPGFTRSMARGFNEWLDGVRGQVAAAHRRGALAQIARARREGRWPDLERWAQQVLRTDPLNEEATLARAESAAMAGSKAVALEILDEYMAELGEHAPKIGLPASVLRRRIAERQPSWPVTGPREVALVGRADEMRRLTAMIDDASRYAGSSAILWGAPGIGKTRLATEVRAYAELNGFLSLSVRAETSHFPRPLSCALALLPQAIDLPGAAGCTPSSLAVLQRLVRQGAGDNSLSPIAAGSDRKDRLHLAFQDLFRSIGEESRVLILLDDAHHVDDASQSLFAAAMAATANTGLQWILTSRARDARWDALSANRGCLRRIHVLPLDDDDTRTLAVALRASDPSRTPLRDVASIARASGGNPLFARELLWQSPSSPESVPPTLQQLMQDRLLALSPAALRLLRASTLLGELATVGRVTACLEASPMRLSDLLEDLETDGIIRLGSRQELELHECWQTAVLDELPDTARAALSLECATVLLQEHSDDPTLARSWRAADLFVAAGERDRARSLFLRCGEQMIQKGAAADALPVLRRALGLAARPDERSEVQLQLARAHYFAGQLADCVRECRAIGLLDQPSTDRGAVAFAVAQSLLVDALTKLREDHRDELLRLQRLIGDPSIPSSARLFGALCGIRVVFNDSQSPFELTFRDTAREIARRDGDSVISSLVDLVWLAERASSADLLAGVERLERLPHREESIQLQAMSLRYQALAYRFLGNWNEAIRRAQGAFELALSSGLLDEAGFCAELLTFVCLDIESIETASDWIARWAEIEARVTYPQRTLALLNARARLMVQRGDFAAALALYRPELQTVASDLLLKRRVSDLATIGYAAARLGLSEDAAAALRVVEAAVENEPPGLLLDYPAELLVRSLVERGLELRASAIAKRYVLERQRRLLDSLPPYCDQLRELVRS